MDRSVIHRIVERSLKNLQPYQEVRVSYHLLDPESPNPYQREFFEIEGADGLDAFGRFMIPSCIKTLVKAGTVKSSARSVKINQLRKQSPLGHSGAQRRTT